MTLARPRAAALNNTRPPLAGAVIVNEGGAQDLDDLLPAMRVRGWVDIQGLGRQIIDQRDWRQRIVIWRYYAFAGSPTALKTYASYIGYYQNAHWVPASWNGPGPEFGYTLGAGTYTLFIDSEGKLGFECSAFGQGRFQVQFDIQASPLIEDPTHVIV